MATIVTVHGTFAGGAETGDAWWQKGSQFETDMRVYVEGADGRLDFVPFAWDGLNSETSRRAAGQALAMRLDELERKGEPYGLIGHSHGGSVILSALTQKTYRRCPLPGLSRWITVGTPFVAFQRKAFLFSRLGLIGRAAYISLMTYACFFALAFWLDNTNKDSRVGLFVIILIAAAFYVAHLLIGWGTDRRLVMSGASFYQSTGNRWLRPRFGLAGRLVYGALLTVTAISTLAVWAPDVTIPTTNLRIVATLVVVVIFACLHFLMAWLSRNVSRWFRRGQKRRRDLAAAWWANWLPLRHSHDEAVEGLRQLPSVSFPIFGKDFATAPLTFAAVMAFPIILVSAVLSPGFMTWLVSTMQGSGLLAGLSEDRITNKVGNDIVANMIFVLFVPMLPIFTAFKEYFSQDAVVLAALILGPVIYMAGAILIVALANVLARVVSRFFSTALDKLAWRQIRASAYGNDTQGEDALSAAGTPASLGPMLPLPDALENEISRNADAAAAASVSKLRASIHRLAFAEDERARSDLVSEYLTWDELIHTAYFKVPLFNKLVAYAIAQSEGFRPSTRFLADPNYSLIAEWHADLSKPILAGPAG